MAGRFSVEAVFRAIDRVSAPVNRMQNRVGKMTRSMESGLNRVNRSMGKFERGIKTTSVAAAASLATVSIALGDIIKTGATFEQTLVNAAAKFPEQIRKGTPAFKLLEDAARRTGAATEFSASQAASALDFLAMAGFNAQQAISALPLTVDLATAAQVDLATATDIATDSLGAFSLMVKNPIQLGKNLARVNDVIARTTTSANTTMELMFDTIREGAPVATAAGASIETFSALTGELANAGIKGTRAGTVLKNMFVRLQAPTGAAASVIKRLGIQLTNQDGSLRDITQIIGQFNKATKSMGAAQRAAALQAVFGMEAIAGVNILMAAGEDQIKAYRRQLEAASGASKTMAGVMRDTLLGRFKTFMSVIEGVKLQIMDMAAGPLNEAVELMTEWVRANGQLIASRIGEFLKMIITNFSTIVLWGKRIAIALGAFLAFTTILKTFVLVMTAVNLVMAMNPIGLMVVGILAAVAAIAVLIASWDKVKGAMSRAANAFIRAWAPVKEAFARTWDEIARGFEIRIAGVMEIIGKIARIGGSIASFFGFGSDARGAQASAGQMVSPQERISRSIEERKTSAEITISDRTGTAEILNSTMGASLRLQPTGGF